MFIFATNCFVLTCGARSCSSFVTLHREWYQRLFYFLTWVLQIWINWSKWSIYTIHLSKHTILFRTKNSIIKGSEMCLHSWNLGLFIKWNTTNEEWMAWQIIKSSRWKGLTKFGSIRSVSKPFNATVVRPLTPWLPSMITVTNGTSCYFPDRRISIASGEDLNFCELK